MRVAILAVVLLSSCGGVGWPSAADPTIEPLPAVTIAGTPGASFSQCWGGVCADGDVPFDRPDLLPGTADPNEVVLTPGWRVDAVKVWDADGEMAMVPVDGTNIGEIPAGPWTVITVHTRFVAGGDAAYAWGFRSWEPPPSVEIGS